MYKKELCIFMYKYHNGLLPSAFDSLQKVVLIVIILEMLMITVLKYTK